MLDTSVHSRTIGEVRWTLMVGNGRTARIFLDCFFNICGEQRQMVRYMREDIYCLCFALLHSQRQTRWFRCSLCLGCPLSLSVVSSVSLLPLILSASQVWPLQFGILDNKACHNSPPVLASLWSLDAQLWSREAWFMFLPIIYRLPLLVLFWCLYVTSKLNSCIHYIDASKSNLKIWMWHS